MIDDPPYPPSRAGDRPLDRAPVDRTDPLLDASVRERHGLAPRDRTLHDADVAGRPPAIAALAALFALGGLLVLFGAFALLGTGFDFGWFGFPHASANPPNGVTAPPVSPLGFSVLFGLLVLTFVASTLAIAYGLWNRHRVAWYGAIGLALLGAVAAFMTLMGGATIPGLLALVVLAVVAWLLLTADVQAWFGIERSARRHAARPI